MKGFDCGCIMINKAIIMFERTEFAEFIYESAVEPSWRGLGLGEKFCNGPGTEFLFSLYHLFILIHIYIYIIIYYFNRIILLLLLTHLEKKTVD